MEFVRDNPGELVPEETFTHYTHRGHQSSLSAFAIYYDTWHPPYSIHVLYSLFPQSLSKFSLVYLKYARLHTYTHTHVLRPSWILSRITRVSRHQKGKTNLDLLEQVESAGLHANLHLDPDT